MSDSQNPSAGPSQRPNEVGVLRQFVIEYLQQHGFDRALQSLTAPDPANPDAEGEDEPTNGAAGGVVGQRRPSAGAAGREARFLAPGPLSIEASLKRNIPQAMTGSASTLSDKVNAGFEAQALYIIDMMQKRAGGKDAGEDGAAAPASAQVDIPNAPESLLDPSDRVDGYRRYRRWVDNGLDLWKPELDALCFPIFAHTFLDLVYHNFISAARAFLEANKDHHVQYHPQEISSLSAINDRQRLADNPYCVQLLHDKYAVSLTQTSHSLLLQWLSGASLDEVFENGRHTQAGRAIEAVKGIVQSRIQIKVVDSSIPLDPASLASTNGLPPTSSGNVEQFNSTKLKLGPAPMTEKLKEQVTSTIRQQDAEANGSTDVNGDAAGMVPNGNAEHANGDGDVEMADGQDGQASQTALEKTARRDTKQSDILPDLIPELDPDLVSPSEGELLPPPPSGLFRTSDVKREVETIRDKRKLIRLGVQDGEGAGVTPVLPSVVAFTVFDSGEGVSSVEFSPDSSILAVGSPESCIRLWSLKGEKLKAKKLDPLSGDIVEDEGASMRKLIGHSGPVYSVAFDPLNGSAAPPQTMLSSSQDGTVRLWSMDSYQNLVVYRGHNRDPVWDVQWGPFGAYFATASRDRTARLWITDRVSPVRMYTGHMGDVNCVQFHPNSLYLATGSHDKSVRMWDVQRGACVRLLMGHTDSVSTIAISPDGRTLASAGLDSSIMLWDLGTSRLIKKMTGHKSHITTLSFSAESATLVSGGLDSTVRVWDVKSAGGAKTGGGIDDARKGVEVGREHGALPMGRGDGQWDDVNNTADLLATFYTKRTPILRAHHTPRNLCMVAGRFVPPSKAKA